MIVWEYRMSQILTCWDSISITVNTGQTTTTAATVAMWYHQAPLGTFPPL